MVVEAATRAIGPQVAERVGERSSRALAELAPLDAFAVAYLSGILDGSLTSSVLADDATFHGFSPSVAKIRANVPTYAKSWLPLLIVGPRGSGKGQLMRTIEATRTGSPSIPMTINLATVAENLAESELFGHVRGAFTGAENARSGIIKTAHETKSALYLDDVAECPEAVQVKLLTCFDDGLFRPVGSDRVVSIGRGRARKFRLYSASQPQALPRLRPDLRDRLSGRIAIIPPLKERGLDVLLLADVALRILSEDAAAERRFSSTAQRLLLQTEWPGNVRQLFNVVGRALALATSADDAPVVQRHVLETSLSEEQWLTKMHEGRESASRHSPDASPRFPTLAEATARHVQNALEQTGGNVAQAARILDIHRTTVHRHIRKARKTDPLSADR